MSLNHLLHEKSLYLRQHASNPVDWYPWGREALDKATREDKPIFLSIGYSACHWCHVMARESFSDEKVADALNRDFVCIKVDREERPDIDSIYMTACQLLTGRGGWPLSIVMTPDRNPFYADSFIPRHSGPGMPGIIELMTQLSRAWKLDRSAVLSAADAVSRALVQFADRFEPHELQGDEIELAYQSLVDSFDRSQTGFDGSPKFPSPHRLMFLIDHHSRTKEAEALEMAMRTLARMRESGLFDHVGYGFFRYSTDGKWHLPHFEKTLYDQAMMALAYIKAFKATGQLEAKETAERILAYVERRLISTQGLFFSAESAESEGEEGKFYLWTLDELERILSPEELAIFVTAFGINEVGNFMDEATHRPTGLNLLDLVTPAAVIADEKGMNETDVVRVIESSLGKMFDEREKRPHPDRDDKVLTDWNGLMIASFAQAAQAFKEARYLEIARKAADGLWLKMQHDGHLSHRLIDTEVTISGFLDDYAFFIWGLLEIYRSSYIKRYLDQVVELTETALEHFSDAKGGFYQTEDSSGEMIVRLKEVYDGAIPSGNSVMAMNLVSLGIITGDDRYSTAARSLFEAFSIELRKNPAAYAHLLSAYAKSKGGARMLAIVGKDGQDAVSGFLTNAENHYNPYLEIVRFDERNDMPRSLRGAILSETSMREPVAFLCSGSTCIGPMHDPSELKRYLITISEKLGRID